MPRFRVLAVRRRILLFEVCPKATLTPRVGGHRRSGRRSETHPLPDGLGRRPPALCPSLQAAEIAAAPAPWVTGREQAAATPASALLEWLATGRPQWHTVDLHLVQRAERRWIVDRETSVAAGFVAHSAARESRDQVCAPADSSEIAGADHADGHRRDGAARSEAAVAGWAKCKAPVIRQVRAASCNIDSVPSLRP